MIDNLETPSTEKIEEGICLLPRESKKRKRNEKITVFLVAFLLRVIFGGLFFGSVDMAVSTQDGANVVGGGLLTYLPYFPVIHVFLWFGGIINILTPLPATLCQKLIPIIFDSLLAVLIYNIIKRKFPGLSFKNGLLYALSPVALIHNSFHGQWDSICLFFLVLAFYIRDFFKEKRSKYFLFGILFGMSFFIKPMTLTFLVVFFKPIPKLTTQKILEYIRNQIYAVLGLISVVSGFIALLAYIGYNMKEVYDKVMGYANNGLVVFGLPHSAPFNQVDFLKSRFWLIGLVAFFAIFYYFKKIEIFEFILLSFSLMIGTCGLAPQYLIWLMPFLLILKFNRLGALYNLACTAFFLLYYMNPQVSVSPDENMATFAALKGFSWLMPPKFLTHDDFIPYINFIGDRIIPAVALTIALSVVIKLAAAIIKKEKSEYVNEPKPLKFHLTKNRYFLFVAGFWFFIVSSYFAIGKLVGKQSLYQSCSDANALKFQKYDMMRLDSGAFYGNYESFTKAGLFNIVFLLSAAALIWSLYTYYLSFKETA
jgi:hypothetical protein